MHFRLLFSFFFPLFIPDTFFALEYLKTVSYVSKINVKTLFVFITDFLFCFLQIGMNICTDALSARLLNTVVNLVR